MSPHEPDPTKNGSEPHGGSTCPDCGAGPENLYPIWATEATEDLSELVDAYIEPDAVGCRSCESSHPVEEVLGEQAEGGDS